MHHSGKFRTSTGVEILNLSGFYIRNCINCVHNFEDHRLLDLLYPQLFEDPNCWSGRNFDLTASHNSLMLNIISMERCSRTAGRRIREDDYFKIVAWMSMLCS